MRITPKQETAPKEEMVSKEEMVPKEEPKEETVPKDDSLGNRALVKVKQGLHTVKVSQYDATQVQREIEGELFDKWHEGCEVMETKGIPVKNIHGFLDHLQEAYDDIDKTMRKKMNAIKWGSEWSYKIVECKYNAGNDSVAKYAMIAFGKSRDGNFLDCMYCLYKLDFKVAPEKIVTKKEHSALWGLFKWETVEEEVKERVLGVKSLKRIKNFFRFKALEGFYQEGLIDQINVVPSLEDVVDEN
ncbi:PREDICTED: uncharacterized protein LOC107355800 isoform X6 [Acropora digitifera]|uniref:uncharacterized protein LOC107355800 isoform X6 n=1 Tax=Acropora digitifera TaxID=70779 RepID=UPI00077A4A8A|nr:PREDICTED: uncharacterized protein LOC107355800 isoform X6 [Acropora digitifera]